jgi:hypothetical protein
VFRQAFQIAGDGLPDIGERIRSCLALTDAARQGRHLDHKKTVFILFDQHPVLHRRLPSLQVRSTPSSITRVGAVLLSGCWGPRDHRRAGRLPTIKDDIRSHERERGAGETIHPASYRRAHHDCRTPYQEGIPCQEGAAIMD